MTTMCLHTAIDIITAADDDYNNPCTVRYNISLSLCNYIQLLMSTSCNVIFTSAANIQPCCRNNEKSERKLCILTSLQLLAKDASRVLLSRWKIICNFFCVCERWYISIGRSNVFAHSFTLLGGERRREKLWKSVRAWSLWHQRLIESQNIE